MIAHVPFLALAVLYVLTGPAKAADFAGTGNEWTATNGFEVDVHLAHSIDRGIFADDNTQLRSIAEAKATHVPSKKINLALDIIVPLGEAIDWTGTFERETRHAGTSYRPYSEQLRLSTGPVLPAADGDIELLLAIDRLDEFGSGFHRRGIGIQLGYTTANDFVRDSITLDWMHYRHAGRDDLFDADRVSLQYAVRADLSGPWQPSTHLRIGLGATLNRWGLDDLSNREGTLELGGNLHPSSRLGLSATLSTSRTIFLAPNPGRSFKRGEHVDELTVGARYLIGKGGALRCEVATLRQVSNDASADAHQQQFGCVVEWAS